MSDVKVYSVHYNRPEFLVLQIMNIKRFCHDDYEFIVLNNGIDNNTKDTISRICEIFNIKEVRFYQDNRHYNCSHDHIQALEYLYENYVNPDIESKIRVVMDSDIIPYRAFSFFTIMNGYDIVGLTMREYFSAIYTQYYKTVDLIDFKINNYCADSGSGTGWLVLKYRTIGMLHTAPMRELEGNYIFANRIEGSLPYDPTFGLQILSKCMVHYYRGTGWDNDGTEYYKRKFNFMLHLINNPQLYKMRLDEISCYENAHVQQWVEPQNYRLNNA